MDNNSKNKRSNTRGSGGRGRGIVYREDPGIKTLNRKQVWETSDEPFIKNTRFQQRPVKRTAKQPQVKIPPAAVESAPDKRPKQQPIATESAPDKRPKQQPMATESAPDKRRKQQSSDAVSPEIAIEKKHSRKQTPKPAAVGANRTDTEKKQSRKNKAKTEQIIQTEQIVQIEPPAEKKCLRSRKNKTADVPGDTVSDKKQIRHVKSDVTIETMPKKNNRKKKAVVSHKSAVQPNAVKPTGGGSIKRVLLDIINSKGYIPLEIAALTPIAAKAAGLPAGGVSANAVAEAAAELITQGQAVFSRRKKLMATAIADAPAGILRGRFSSSTRGFGFVTPEGTPGGDDIFIPTGKSGGAMDGDNVTVQLEPARDDSNTVGGKTDGIRIRGEVVSVTDRSRGSVIAVLEERVIAQNKRALFAVPDNKKINCVLQITDRADGCGAVKSGDKAEVEITKYPPAADGLGEGRILRVFGNAESCGANYLAILHENEIKTEFDRDVLQEADEVSAMPLTPAGRLDLRGEIIFTIDGEDAKDLDDAISVKRTSEGWILGVHIADVSHYVAEGSRLDAEASERGTSVYFTDKVVPMLPEVISNGSCSLLPGTDKYAMSAFVTLGRDGSIKSCELRESMISTAVRGVYSEVNDLLDCGMTSEYFAKYSAVYPSLLEMRLLYEGLLERSRGRGMLELESPEPVIILDSVDNPVEIVRRGCGIGEKMIEQFMLCANEAVASWLNSISQPCVYRVHEDPAPDKLQIFFEFAHNLGLTKGENAPGAAKNPLSLRRLLRKILNTARDRGIIETVSGMMLRALAKAKYSSSPSPHFGLGIETYCHFTSPIRRYPDLATHRIIRAVLRNESAGRRLAELEIFARESAASSSASEIRALNAERAIESLYKTIYMSGFIGEEFDASVRALGGFGIFAELGNTCEGFIPINSMNGYFNYNEKTQTLSRGRLVYSLGSKLRIRVESADISARRVIMSIVDG